jgi:hypothetical protein
VSAPVHCGGHVLQRGQLGQPGPAGVAQVPGARDCGIGSRVGHAEIVWAKLSAMAAGAEIASKELWKR